MQTSTDAGLDVGLRELASDFVGGFPACAVPWHHNRRSDGGQLRNGARDNGLEQSSGKVKSADEGIDDVDACQLPDMSQDIDDARMAATREHNKSLVLEMADDSLVVPNPGIGCPSTVRPGLLEGEAFLEIRHALDLPSHQDHAVKQE